MKTLHSLNLLAVSLVGTLILLALLVSCAPIGPGTVTRDRFDYTTAVADSWKRQMLLNIVKIRYGDAPIFLDVASIINQYALDTQVTGAFGWSFPPNSNSQMVGGTVRYIDRPTITYNLMTGEKFARNLMTPIPPTTIMSMVEGGYPIDLMFRILVHSINGIKNQFGGSARAHHADPAFYTILEKMRRIQASGAVSLRVKKIDQQSNLVMVFRRYADKEQENESREVRRLLGIKEDAAEFKVVYGSVSEGDGEIALLTRSILEILSDISSTVEVPSEHVIQKRVNPTVAPDGEGIKGPMVRIQCTSGRPGDDFAAVPYRGYWFWIDDRNYGSKRLFSFLMFLMTLTETGGKEGAPIVTINAGG